MKGPHKNKKARPSAGEAQFKDLADSLPEAICEADTAGKIIYALESGLKAFGYIRKDLEAEINAFDLVIAEEREEARENIAKVLAGEDLGWIEHTGLRKDGTTFPLEVHSARVLREGGPAGFRSIAVDITRRKKAAEETRKARERFQQLYEYAPVAYHTLLPDGVITNVNKKWCRTLEYGKSEAIGKSIFEFVVPEERRSAVSSFAEKKKSKETFKHGHERHYLTKSGEVRTLVTSDFFSLDADGKIVSVHTTLEDVTERKRIEQDLRKSNMELSAALEELKRTQQRVIQEERLRVLGQIASGVAHDFNNVLMPILGLSEMACSDSELRKDSAEMYKILGDIHEAAKHAREIVRRMREFYRPADDADFTSVNLNTVVESGLLLTQQKWQQEARANGRHIDVRTELGTVPDIRGVKSELHEVLTNFIFNSVDAITGDGEITVRTCQQEGRVVLEVEDTGCGMTEEVRLHCLEPFFTGKEGESSGQGLAVVYGIVRRHGGSLEVKSQPDKGTTVTARFPPMNAGEAETEKRIKADERNAADLRILIIEDESSSRQLLSRYLDPTGKAVVTAECGEEGIRKSGEQEFDLVITDRAMPDMSGDNVALEVKKLRADVPVIMLTGFGTVMKENGEKPHGVDEVVGKPVTRKELQKAISRVLTRNVGVRPDCRDDVRDSCGSARAGFASCDGLGVRHSSRC
ncbi:MAG: PAS domain S-box protein [Kiritimatiellia bacterium]